MPNQIRLLLDAKTEDTGASAGPELVSGVSVRFQNFGAGSTAALKASPQPAQIELFSRFVDSARQTQGGAGTSIGKLPGQLSLKSGRVLFLCDPADITQLNTDFRQAVDDSAQQDPAPHRALALSLAGPDFAGFDPQAPPARLLLPADPGDHSHLEVLAELSIAGQVEAARDKNDILDVPLRVGIEFPVPLQKKGALADVGPDPGPILLASNDPSFVPGPGSIRDKVKSQNQKRDEDTSPSTNPGGDFIPFHVVSTASRPAFTLDHGFLDDGKGGIDASKRQSPTAKDFATKAKWVLILNGAETLRPDLIDATIAYRHFLDESGTDLTFSYERFAKTDRTGAQIVASAIDDVRAAAVELSDPRGGNHFLIQSDAIPAGAADEQGLLLNPRYGYPGTENWQKAIGAHVVWIEADVTTGVDARAGAQTFVIKMTLHAEDRYNFNPGNADIATGTLDAENGRFEVTGLGAEFLSLATLTRTISLTIPPGPVDFRKAPPGQVVSGPNRK